MSHAESLIRKFIDQRNQKAATSNELTGPIFLSDCERFWVGAGFERRFLESENDLYLDSGGGWIMLHIETQQIYQTGPVTISNFIRDFYEPAFLQGRCYVLRCSHQPTDKKAMLRLKRLLTCSPKTAKALVSQNRAWFEGRCRLLETMQEWLNEHDVSTSIEVVEDSDAIHIIDTELFYYSDHLNYLNTLANKIP